MGCSWIRYQDKNNQKTQPDPDGYAALQGKGKKQQACSQGVAFGGGMQPVINIRQAQQTKSADKEKKEAPNQEDDRDNFN